MTKYKLGEVAVAELCRVLNLEGTKTQRVVIDIQFDGLVTVYLQQLSDDVQFNGILDLLANAPKVDC